MASLRRRDKSRRRGEAAINIRAFTAVSRVISFFNRSRKMGRQRGRSALSESPRLARICPLKKCSLCFLVDLYYFYLKISHKVGFISTMKILLKWIFKHLTSKSVPCGLYIQYPLISWSSFQPPLHNQNFPDRRLAHNQNFTTKTITYMQDMDLSLTSWSMSAACSLHITESYMRLT